MENYSLTIFTPTYNRAYLLPRLYESLIKQTKKEFVWLVVDDGSNDNTSIIINEWIKDNKIIHIKYIYQQNSGKMKAHNRGVRECETELFMCLDSDDYLSDNCVERIYINWDKYRDNPRISGMVAYKKLKGRTSYYFPEVEFSTLNNLGKGIRETALTYRTSVLCQNLFPEFEGEKFIAEGIVYDKLDLEYLLAVVPEYWMFCEYQDEGYTTNAIKLLIMNPRGWALNAKQKYIIFATDFFSKIRWTSTYICASLFAGYKLQCIVNEAPNKMMCLFCFPIGWMQKKYNQRRIRK